MDRQDLEDAIRGLDSPALEEVVWLVKVWARLQDQARRATSIETRASAREHLAKISRATMDADK